MTKSFLQQNFEFYRNPQVPIIGSTPSSSWKCPGSALSASSVRIMANWAMKIVDARWVLVWNPNSATDAYNAVRLVKADNGPANLEQIAFLNKNNTVTPVVGTVDLTSAMTGILDGCVSKHILQQTCGDTESKIYASWIECVFEIDTGA